MMMWLRTCQLGIKSLLLHPMRSLLTVLGIFVGVASVIWLLAIGEGISAEAQKQIASLGAENIIVRSVKPPAEALADVRGPVTYGLTRADLLKIEANLPTLEVAIPIREMRKEIRNGPKLVDGRLVGCKAEYQDVARLEIDRGRFLTAADEESAASHCVLSAEVAQRLFAYENPLGNLVRVESDQYQVVGVLKSKSASAAIGGSLAAQDYSNDVYVPLATVRARYADLVITRRSGSFEGEEVQLNQITLRIKGVDSVVRSAELLKTVLEHHNRTRDVVVVVPLELLEQARTTRMMFMLFMGFIAGISLIVGGIGIMNIMLATVTERTREIGIRRALGARRRDIVRQFLVETIVLSVVGGLTGILGGLACLPALRLARAFVDANFPQTMAQLPAVARTVEPLLVPASIPLAFGISVLVGLIFGIYPAIRAAYMNPIEALRHSA